MMTTEQKFIAAVDVITSLPKNGPFQPSEEVMLKFNSYYKQAMQGPCNVSRPLFFDQKKREWYAWKSLGNMPKEVAMQKYIEQLLEVIETMSYTETVSNFIELIGPFYEVAHSEDGAETDHLKTGECSPVSSLAGSMELLSNESPPEMIEAVETMSDESFEVVPPPDQSEQLLQVEKIMASCSEESVHLDQHRVSFSDSPQSHDSDIVLCSKVPRIVTDDEVLSASILSLQKSLSDVIQHIDYLEDLINAYECEMVNSSKNPSWSLSPFSLAVVVFWPFVAHWIVHIVQQRRNIA